MSDTPRVDACIAQVMARSADKKRTAENRIVHLRDAIESLGDLSQGFERELTAAHKRIAELEQVSAPDAKDAPGIGSDEHEWYIRNDAKWHPFFKTLHYTDARGRAVVEAGDHLEAIRYAMAKESK